MKKLPKALRASVKQRRDSIEQYNNAGRSELAEKEAAEISVLEEYLPQAAPADEIDAAVAAGRRRNRSVFDERMGDGNESRNGETARKSDGRKSGQRGGKGKLNGRPLRRGQLSTRTN